MKPIQMTKSELEQHIQIWEDNNIFYKIEGFGNDLEIYLGTSKDPFHIEIIESRGI